ncbi:MAG: hypothetical protein IPM35_18580 [Myxococcales bacterium]|nr:hypothetical protein [Myxococcales bacterium]
MIVPSFALERAQEIVYALKGLREAGRLPPIPVYVDSPLAVKITDVFKLHPGVPGRRGAGADGGDRSPFDSTTCTTSRTSRTAKALNASNRPCIVISASGMCEAGRILHHLKAGVSDSKNAVLIVGYQAPHTLGRRLVERRSQVKIFGTMTPVHAESTS